MDNISSRETTLTPVVDRAGTTRVLLYIATALLGYVVYEQLAFHFLKKGQKHGVIPGPTFAVPLLGGLLAMVNDPYGFWEQQRLYKYEI